MPWMRLWPAMLASDSPAKPLHNGGKEPDKAGHPLAVLESRYNR